MEIAFYSRHDRRDSFFMGEKPTSLPPGTLYARLINDLKKNLLYSAID
jgi:hypothetical protein